MDQLNDSRNNFQSKIFVNRPVNLSKIKHYGFDMDYTLALYKWPVYHEALFLHALDSFVAMGYPEELGSLTYDIDFPVRGLWFDTLYGCFLKVDSFGNILMCALGYQMKSKRETEELYPGRFVTFTDRMYIFNTPFHIPELMFFAAVINHFVQRDAIQGRGLKTGVHIEGGKFKLFNELFKDMREAIEIVHMKGHFKKYILDHISEYVEKDEKMPVLLHTLKNEGKKIFLVTNSDWEYTNGIMSYLFDQPMSDEFQGANWYKLFDLVVTNSRKPKFFKEGSKLFRVNPETGEHVAMYDSTSNGTMQPNEVYSGGNVDQLEDALDVGGKPVLYVGDHIFGDILKCKKHKGWKTFLVVEELDHQIACWVKCKPLIKELERVDIIKASNSGQATPRIESYQNGHHVNGTENGGGEVMSVKELEKASHAKWTLKEKLRAVDLTYGKLGGLFQSGSRETFFASQVKGYADIYATRCTHLLNYPLCFHFHTARQRLPHEMACDEIPEWTDLEDSFDSRHREENRMTSSQMELMMDHLPNIRLPGQSEDEFNMQ